MDPITIAMALAQFAPQVVRWISGSDKAAEAAGAVVDIATQVTGAATGKDAVSMLGADPAMVLEFRRAVAAQEAELDKAFLADRADARARDVALAQAGRNNRRADVMVLGAVVGLLACLVVLVRFQGQVPGEVVGIVSTVAGLFGACLRDAFQFEFGSSRGSAEKAADISAALERLKK